MRIIAIILLLASAAYSGPLRVAPDPASFGLIVEQPTEDLRLDVRLTNATNAPLRIARIDTGCKCTQADFPAARTLAAKETVVVPVYLNRFHMQVGDEQMSLSVIDDRETTIATVAVTYQYHPILQTFPTQVTAGDEPGGAIVARFQVIATESVAQRGVTFKSNDPEVVVTFRKTAERIYEVQAARRGGVGARDVEIRCYTRLVDAHTPPDLVVPILFDAPTTRPN